MAKFVLKAQSVLSTPSRRLNIGGVIEPAAQLERPRRQIPGLEGEFEVTRTGMVYSGELNELFAMDRFPFCTVISGDRLLEINGLAAAAAVWLTPEQRSEIRNILVSGAKHEDPSVMMLAKSLQVSKHVIALVANTADEAVELIKVTEEPTGDEHQIESAQIQDYLLFLVEKHRPPSKGGNTSALHAHALVIGGVKYRFIALGSQQWVHKADRVWFHYRTDEQGYHRVFKSTLRVVDKDGRPQQRGNRGFKKTLRTAVSRMPASRREQRS